MSLNFIKNVYSCRIAWAMCRANAAFKVETSPAVRDGYQIRLILNPAVEANRHAEIHLESTRSAVSAQAETHGKPKRWQRFLLAWIPAFAGMTAPCVLRWPVTLRVMFKNCEHAVSPDVSAS
jgi:hypothetical protein